MGDDLSPLSPQGSLKRAGNSVRMKPEVRKEESKPFKIPVVCVSPTYLPCAHSDFVLFFPVCFSTLNLLQTFLLNQYINLSEVNILGLRQINWQLFKINKYRMEYLCRDIHFSPARPQNIYSGEGRDRTAATNSLLWFTQWVEPLRHFEDVNNISCCVILSHLSIIVLRYTFWYSFPYSSLSVS